MMQIWNNKVTESRFTGTHLLEEASLDTTDAEGMRPDHVRLYPSLILLSRLAK